MRVDLIKQCNNCSILYVACLRPFSQFLWPHCRKKSVPKSAELSIMWDYCSKIIFEIVLILFQFRFIYSMLVNVCFVKSKHKCEAQLSLKSTKIPLNNWPTVFESIDCFLNLFISLSARRNHETWEKPFNDQFFPFKF